MNLLHAKMVVHQISIQKDDTGTTIKEDVVLSVNPNATENQEWASGSPSSDFTITITNPKFFGFLNNTKEVFLDVNTIE